MLKGAPVSTESTAMDQERHILMVEKSKYSKVKGVVLYEGRKIAVPTYLLQEQFKRLGILT